MILFLLLSTLVLFFGRGGSAVPVVEFFVSWVDGRWIGRFGSFTSWYFNFGTCGNLSEKRGRRTREGDQKCLF